MKEISFCDVQQEGRPSLASVTLQTVRRCEILQEAVNVAGALSSLQGLSKR